MGTVTTADLEAVARELQPTFITAPQPSTADVFAAAARAGVETLTLNPWHRSRIVSRARRLDLAALLADLA